MMWSSKHWHHLRLEAAAAQQPQQLSICNIDCNSNGSIRYWYGSSPNICICMHHFFAQQGLPPTFETCSRSQGSAVMKLFMHLCPQQQQFLRIEICGTPPGSTVRTYAHLISQQRQHLIFENCSSSLDSARWKQV